MVNTHWLRIVLDVPLFASYDYRSSQLVPVGTRVIVSFGKRKVVGVVVEHPEEPSVPADQVKEIDQILDDIPPLPKSWLHMAEFAASYYQRPLGEVILPALPANLRKVAAYQGKRSAGGPVERLKKRKAPAVPSIEPIDSPVLTNDQKYAIDQVNNSSGHNTFMLFGVTGSGKTEVYIQLAANAIQKGRQVLILVPEINLTPQLEKTLRGRLSVLVPEARIAVMHSALSDGERLRSWLQAESGEADIILGTRLAVFAVVPRLGLIVVDEEHDASYKQQDGLRYSARDMAVWRAHSLGIPVVLGSATPSLESWNHVQLGRYKRIDLQNRARNVAMPEIKLIDTRRLVLEQGLAPLLIESIKNRLSTNEQVLLFINRRGYSPVLGCVSCGWVSQCTRCTAYMVLHRGARQSHNMQCHHCGDKAWAPRACPDCGDPDLKPMGRGTQRIEEFIATEFPQARIVRLDADSTRIKGRAAELLATMHSGEADILIGTQMVAKGHDFANLGLVGVLNADAMLFAHDFRAPERLFAQLVQVSGRAGRHSQGAQVLIQTDYPDQPVFQSLLQHDYEGYAASLLAERQAVGLPPYVHQALLICEAKDIDAAISFLGRAGRLPELDPTNYPTAGQVNIYDPVPLRVLRVANVERAQLLIDSYSRPALQAFLQVWSRALPNLARKHRVRHTLEVDPQYI